MGRFIKISFYEDRGTKIRYILPYLVFSPYLINVTVPWVLVLPSPLSLPRQ